ncbi:hypothetical protein Q7P37_006791 [Cladosporium fusiforme]
MARFYPLYVRRSDGKKEIFAKGKVREPNQPTDVQLDQRPDKNGVSDFYREVAPDEIKHLDWRRKLGGMLARELGWKDPSGGDNGCILVTFPEGYRLYEHVKKTEKDGQTEVKTKTHAGGGNDRQDAYLYGHPTGRRKRFRSPADFFPHMLWMCTDESGDPDNCSCKICSPEELDAVIPGAKNIKTEKPTKPEVKVEGEKPLAVISQASPPATSIATQLSSRPASALQQQQQQQAHPQTQSMPSLLPPAKSPDQQEDRRYGSFMYRPGEVVWFSRVQAWGLGVVLRRWKSSSGQVSYTVQPLTYPGGPSVAVTKSSEFDMRPWLAWSVPAFTHAGLNNTPEPPRYDTLDWNAVRRGAYGPGGDMEVDGSILAAKSTDATYTPFGQIQILEVEPGVSETYYDGLYLGGEKIWVGEPVRLVIGSGTDIMIVHSIVERRTTAAMTGQIIQQSMHVVGDIYSLANIQHSDPNVPTPAAPKMNPQLPERLTQDLAYRNARSIHVNRVASYWKFMRGQARIDLDAVKGRWYEASILLPVLQGQAAFDNMSAKGDIQEASLWMNSRGDCQNANRPANLPKVRSQNIRKQNRRDAIGAALPAGAKIQETSQPQGFPTNVDPALNESSSQSLDIDPRFDTAQDAGPGEAGMDHFMGLDPHTEMPGFGQQYGITTHPHHSINQRFEHKTLTFSSQGRIVMDSEPQPPMEGPSETAQSTNESQGLATSTENMSNLATTTASSHHRSGTTTPNYGTLSSPEQRPALLHAQTAIGIPNTTPVANPNLSRPLLTRAATESAAVQRTARPGILKRISTRINEALDLSTENSYTHRNRPQQPSHWTDHAHWKALLQLWDASKETAEANQTAKLPRSIAGQLVAVEKDLIAQFPELKEGEVPLSRQWMEYVLGVALRHPFCAEGKMGRWEVLSGAAKVGVAGVDGWENCSVQYHEPIGQIEKSGCEIEWLK